MFATYKLLYPNHQDFLQQKSDGKVMEVMKK